MQVQRATNRLAGQLPHIQRNRCQRRAGIAGQDRVAETGYEKLVGHLDARFCQFAEQEDGSQIIDTDHAVKRRCLAGKDPGACARFRPADDKSCARLVPARLQEGLFAPLAVGRCRSGIEHRQISLAVRCQVGDQLVCRSDTIGQDQAGAGDRLFGFGTDNDRLQKGLAAQSQRLIEPAGRRAEQDRQTRLV